jgi:hypothetical protein
LFNHRRPLRTALLPSTVTAGAVRNEVTLSVSVARTRTAFGTVAADVKV